MIISKVSFTRKFSLGNFENLDLSIEAQLNEKDNPLDVWSVLSDNTENWFREHQKKDKVIAGRDEGKTTVSAPSVASPPKPSTTPLQMPEAIEHLTTASFIDGFHIITPKHFLPPADFNIVNDWVKQQHGEYVKATNDVPGHWKVKT
jgi:hypothetical protein